MPGFVSLSDHTLGSTGEVAEPMLPEPYRVVKTTRETHDTVTLVLQPQQGDRVLAFAPGQFTMLYAFGVGEVPISLSGDPTDSTVLQQTIRRVGNVTAALAGLRKGDELGLRGPFGSSWPIDEAEGHDLLIIAGGIGLAPLRPALYQVIAERERFGRVAVLYGARTPAELLFVRELARWRGRFDLEVLVTVDRSAPGWTGEVGVVTRLVSRVRFDPRHTKALVCGPEVMMKFAARALTERGVAPVAIAVSLERNMKCAVGSCGHCQLGPYFVCRDGPVFGHADVAPLLAIPEV